MKNALSIIALTAATTFAAPLAASNIQDMEIAVERFVNGADLTKLSETELAQLNSVIHSGGSFGERQAQIWSILDENDALVEDEATAFFMTDDQYSALEAELARYGDYDIDMLSKNELMTLVTVIYSGGAMGEKSAKIQAIFVS